MMKKRFAALVIGILTSWVGSAQIEPVFFEACPGDGVYDSLKQQEWKLVSLVAAGSGYDIYSAWQSSFEKNDSDCDVTRVLTGDSSEPSGFTSSFVDRFWNRVKEVRVSIYKDGMEKAFVNFGASENKTSWFEPSNVKDSVYTDLPEEETNTIHFSMGGDVDIATQAERRFLIWKSFGSCPYDLGWIMVSHLRAAEAPCPRDNGMQPLIFYSSGSSAASETGALWTFYQNSFISGNDVESTSLPSPDSCKDWCLTVSSCSSVDYSPNLECFLNYEGAQPIEYNLNWRHYQLEMIETLEQGDAFAIFVKLFEIDCGSTSNSNFADVNVAYSGGDVNITCDVGYHVSGQSLTRATQVTRCQLDGTLIKPVACEEPWVVVQPQSLLEVAVDGNFQTCVALPATYSTHYIRMCSGHPTQRFDVHINTTDYSVCNETEVSMRPTPDVTKEDSCETGTEYKQCTQYERCSYSCQDDGDVICAVLFLQMEPGTKTEKLCEIDFSFP